MKTGMKLEQIEIHGDCDPRFSAVKEVFADNFRQRGDVGASFAAVLPGGLQPKGAYHDTRTKTRER